MSSPLKHLLAAALCLIAAGALGVGCASSTAKQPRGISNYVQAVQAYQGGDRDRAINDLARATRANPDLIMAHLMLGDLYREGGDYQKAADQYQALVKLDPYTWSNFYKLGVSYQFLDRLRDAVKSYEHALKLNPDDANTNMNFGLVQLYLGNKDQAVNYCQRATLLDPKSAAAFSNLGVALDAKGQYARAEAAYRHSLDIDPDNTTTLLNLGTNLIAQDKGAEAVEILQRVVQASNTAMHRKRYGDALAKAGRFDDAIEQYNAALKLDPKYAPALNALGWTRIAQYRAGHELDDSLRDQAVEFWKQSLAIKADQPDIQQAIAKWSGKNGLLR